VKAQEDSSMTQGTIKTIRDDKGFGFIKPDTGTQDVFFHSSSVNGGGFDQLREGDRVEFTEGTDPRNPGPNRAETVRPVE
jgi:CspA family cold shock protein